jgi:diaminobutyrate-2-oxoglutarate transaminase
MNIAIFNAHESDVRRYCRTFPVLLDSAAGPRVFDVTGRGYLDFILGSGALNYGHNHPAIKSALQEYLARDSILLSLDMYTEAKARFISEMVTGILGPRSFDYKIQFPGPTGTSANEAAMALARKVTGRPTIFAFSNSFHGMSLGSLCVSGSESTRDLGGIAKHDVVRLPYDGFISPDFASQDYLECVVTKPGAGVDQPAAIILETIQAEGGLNTASVSFLRSVERICRENGILLIVDDIQAGSGRTGSFFSFEEAGITPDIVTLSKSLSGLGIPLSVVLIRPEFDIWKPGEHSGTFRGNNMAFVTGAAALSLWRDDDFLNQVSWLTLEMDTRLDQLCKAFPDHITSRKGRGLMCGVEVAPSINARDVIAGAFARGLILESSGPDRQVLKVFAPLTIEKEPLDDAFGILTESFEEVIHEG